MAIIYLHLIRLAGPVSSDEFQRALRAHAASYRFRVVVFSQIRHPQVANARVVDVGVADQEWCSMAVLEPIIISSSSSSDSGATTATTTTTDGGAVLPNTLAHLFLHYYTLRCAVSSGQLGGFAARNASLHANAGAAGAAFDEAHLRRLRRGEKGQLKDSSQDLEASAGLLDFAAGLLPVHGLRPVTMLNLLKFNDEAKGGPGLASYKEYGRAFATQVGAKRGGDAKLVGKVLAGALLNGTKPTGGAEQWDEFAIVHYPNIVAFCDMAAGEDYQAANHKYRLPALRDTMLLASREMPLAAEPSSGPAKSGSELGGGVKL